MIIHAREAPIELILYVRVWDAEGEEIPRVVFLDTDNMIAKQYIREGLDSSLNEVCVSKFEFTANNRMTAQMLRDLLPPDLHDKVVSVKT